jgi:Rad3-related DNA helicase
MSAPAATVPCLRVSVGHLAAFVHRSGDLGPSGSPSVRALEGLRRQQRHQAGADARWRAEVRLSHRWSDGRVELEIGGRADGVRTGPDGVLVEEIKTFRGDLDAARAREGSVHEAQVKLYGALWLAGAGDAPGPLSLRLTYLDADDDAVHPVPVDADPQALADFLETTCRAYADWMETERRRLAARDAALATLDFPHAFRPGQRALARAVWRTLEQGGTLLAEAPTGIGKTLATTYAALRRLPGLSAERVLYLTARGSGRRLALDAAATLAASGTPIRAVELRARERICPTPGTPCRADACPRARGHHDRRRGALAALLGHDAIAPEAILDGERTAAVAEAHRVCPAALQHDAARFADLVVADVNFALDPFARQRALVDGDDGGAVALVDEAHHLVERGRAMWSATLDGAALRALRTDAGVADCPFRRELDGLLRALGALTPGEAPAAGDARVARLRAAAERLADALSAWLAAAPGGGLARAVQELLGTLLRLVECALAADGEDGEAWRLDVRGSAVDPVLDVTCLAPAPRLGPALGALEAVVGFSATLAPVEAHRGPLGLPETTAVLAVPNPFPPERRLLLQVDDVDLRARSREAALPAVAAAVADLVRARAGHYLLCLPSFAFLEALDARLAEALPEAERHAQRRGMDERARAAFLAPFETPDGRTRIGLVVSGGLFSEGVDLPGDRLVGVVVVGLPVPAPDVERRALRDYHRGRGLDGDAVAFRVPAMTRVRQAAGRLIRDADDVGIVCLIDARLATPVWRALVPDDWCVERLRADAVGARARRFWAAATA